MTLLWLLLLLLLLTHGWECCTRVCYCCRNLNPTGSFETDAWIERILIVGVARQPSEIMLAATGESLVESCSLLVCFVECVLILSVTTSQSLLEQPPGRPCTTWMKNIHLSSLDLGIHEARDTHTLPRNGPFSRTTRVNRYQKGKISLDFTEARDSEWPWHQLGHMQVCTSLQTDNHANTLPVSFYRPDALPAIQPTASKH